MSRKQADDFRARRVGVRHTNEAPAPANMGAAHFLTAAAPWHGQRVRVSGYLKTENLGAWAGLNARVVTLGRQ
jgi:hypothetical protein